MMVFVQQLPRILQFHQLINLPCRPTPKGNLAKEPFVRGQSQTTFSGRFLCFDLSANSLLQEISFDKELN